MSSDLRPTGVDLYCGVGGMSLGFEQAGFNVIAGADIEKINVATHSNNFPECKTWCTDLSSASGAQFRKETGIEDRHIDVLFSGPPCQGFSLIGKRSQEDPRNLLVYEFARLIGELLPSYVVMENVEGILLGKERNTLDGCAGLLNAAGYSVVEPIQVLDAAELGVTQRRRRVFVLGYQRGNVAPRYPETSHPYSKNGEVQRPTVWDAIADLPKVASYQYLLTADEYEGELGAPTRYASILRGEARDPEDKSLHRTRNGDGLGGCLRTSRTATTLGRFSNTKPGRYEDVNRFDPLQE